MGLFPLTVLDILKFVSMTIFVFSLCFCSEADIDCESGKLDLVIILDTSKSVGEKNFPKCINFIENLLTSLPVEPDLVRVALVRYSNEAQVVSYLNQGMTKGEKIKDVLRIKYIKGSTFTNLALRITDLDVLTPAKGDRQDVSDLVILITDGESSDPNLTMEETESLKQRSNLKIFTIGVGKEIHEEELQAIASDSGYSVSVDSFTELAGLIQNMTSVTCIESTKASLLVSYDELPKDIFYSDHMMSAKELASRSSDHNTQASGHATQESGHVTQARGHDTQASDHVTQASGHDTQARGHVTQARSHVTQASGHVTQASGHDRQASGHVTQASGHDTQANGHDTQASGHVTQARGHVTQARGHVTQASGHVTQANGHVTQASGHDTQANGHDTQASDLVTQASGHDTQASGHDTQASGHDTPTIGHVTQTSARATHATGHYTQSNGHATQERDHVTQATGNGTRENGLITQSSVKREKTNDTTIETDSDGNITSIQDLVTVSNITVPDSTRAYNLTLGGVRAATFLTYLGIAIGAFVATLGAVTFIAVVSRNKCSQALSTEL